VRKRKDNIVESFRKSNRESYENTEHLDLLMGEGTFADRQNGEHTMCVQLDSGGEKLITATNIFINTGSHSATPPIPGIEEVDVLDETSILDIEELPEHLAILGAGYIGLEYAQMFRRFGSDVTLIEIHEHVLRLEDKDIAHKLQEILESFDIEFWLESSLEEIDQKDGTLHLQVKTPEGKRQIQASHLLVAVGRSPNTAALNLDKVGIETDDDGYIEVNERLETDVPGIFAMGDVKGGPEFTHIAYDDFRVVRDNLLYDGDETITGRNVPYTVYTQPQLGRVGLTEKEAKRKNLDYRVAYLPVSQVARAIEIGETQGVMKALVNEENDEILGCAILCPQGGEIMSIVQVAMIGNLPYTALRDAILAHPTFAESLNTLFGNINGPWHGNDGQF
jgi:pyruvate/2-oxoglutarate dehydrogenase complex dihydrolipoamide dehydrogenase (E3) component